MITKVKNFWTLRGQRQQSVILLFRDQSNVYLKIQTYRHHQNLQTKRLCITWKISKSWGRQPIWRKTIKDRRPQRRNRKCSQRSSQFLIKPLPPRRDFSRGRLLSKWISSLQTIKSSLINGTTLKSKLLALEPPKRFTSAIPSSRVEHGVKYMTWGKQTFYANNEAKGTFRSNAQSDQ